MCLCFACSFECFRLGVCDCDLDPLALCSFCACSMCTLARCLLMGCSWLVSAYGMPMHCLWVAYGLPMACLCPWYAYGLPMAEAGPSEARPKQCDQSNDKRKRKTKQGAPVGHALRRQEKSNVTKAMTNARQKQSRGAHVGRVPAKQVQSDVTKAMTTHPNEARPKQCGQSGDKCKRKTK